MPRRRSVRGTDEQLKTALLAGARYRGPFPGGKGYPAVTCEQTALAGDWEWRDGAARPRQGRVVGIPVSM